MFLSLYYYYFFFFKSAALDDSALFHKTSSSSSKYVDLINISDVCVSKKSPIEGLWSVYDAHFPACSVGVYSVSPEDTWEILRVDLQRRRENWPERTWMNTHTHRKLYFMIPEIRNVLTNRKTPGFWTAKLDFCVAAWENPWHRNTLTCFTV